MENQTTQNPIRDEILNQPPKQSYILPILFFLFGFLLLISTSLLAYQNWQLRQQLNAPTTYAECLKAPGSILQESYPATCVTKDGKKSFKQILTDEEKKNLELPADPTSSWKTYVDGSFSFKYPPSITITDTVQGLGTIFKIVGLDKEISLAVEPITDHNFYADKKISNTFTFNKVDWNYLTGNTQFCDGGECGRISDALQTTERGKRYTIVLGNLPYPNTIVDQILSTFKFIDNTSEGILEATVMRSPTCPGAQKLGEICTAPVANETFKIIKPSNNEVVQTVTTDKDGKFAISLTSGTYQLQSPTNGIGKNISNQNFTITSGKTTTQEFDIDTGIR